MSTKSKSTQITTPVLSDSLIVGTDAVGDLNELNRLHELSIRLVSASDLEPMLRELLNAALDLHKAQKGIVSLCDDENSGLKLQVAAGFTSEFLKCVQSVPSGTGACGTSLHQRRRVIVENVATSKFFDPIREAVQIGGFQAVHSTPLSTSAGRIIGVLSVHFTECRRPSDTEIRFMDVYARLASDLIEATQLRLKLRKEQDERRDMEMLLLQKQQISEQRCALSEARLRQVIELMPMGVYTCDEAGRITLYNRKAVEIWGREPNLMDEVERFCGTYKVYTLEGLLIERSQTPMARAVLHGESFRNVEAVVERPDGSRLTASVNIDPLTDERGRRIGAINVFHDVTAHRESARALRESEDRLRIATDAGNIGTWEWDIVNDQVVWSEQVYRLHGLTREEFGGRSVDFERLVHSDDRTRVISCLEHALKDGADYAVEFRASAPNGEIHWFWTRAVVIRNNKGLPIRMVGFLTDIDDRKRAEEVLREADRRKNEFLAMLAHELRNPLGPIRNAVHLLRKCGPNDSRTDRLHGMIERQSTHMTRIVDDLLDVSRITRGMIVLNRELVNVAELAREVANDYNEGLGAANLRLNVVTPPEPVMVSGDHTRLSQAVGNLIHNAIKFSKVGGEISINVEAIGSDAIISVLDNGIGIEPHLVGTLFEPFSQGSQALDRKHGGLGLGLALVKGLVILHGGSVSVYSDGMNKGARFNIQLPLSNKNAGKPAVAAQPFSEGRKLRILIIEDNADAAESMEMLLKLSGHQVEVAHSGLEALQHVPTLRPDIVLCDIGLPEMDGYTVCREMRKLTHSTMKFIALTGYGQDEDVKRAKEAGFHMHLTKPLDPTRLEAVLASVC